MKTALIRFLVFAQIFGSRIFGAHCSSRFHSWGIFSYSFRREIPTVILHFMIFSGRIVYFTYEYGDAARI